MNSLWKRAKSGDNEFFSRLYLAVVIKYLEIRFHTGELKGGIYTTYDFELPATPEIFELRQEIWLHLIKLYQIPNLQRAVLDVVHKYSTSLHMVSDKEILIHDATQALPFFRSNLDPQSYSHCLFVQDYLDALDRYKVPFDEALRDHFENEASKLSEILLSDRLERRALDLDEKSYQQFRKQRFETHFDGYTLDDYKRFFGQCLLILNQTSDNRRYQFQIAVADVLVLLAARDPKLYVKVLEHYLYIGEPLELIPTFQIIRALIDIQGDGLAQATLLEFDYSTKQRWLFGFFGCLSQSEITIEHVEQLYALYQSAKLEDLLNDLSYLNRYREADQGIVSRVVRILLEKAKQEPRYANALASLFYRYGDINGKLTEIFKNDIGTLREVYLAVLSVDNHYDHDGTIFSSILDVDTNFLVEYLSRMYPKKNWFSRYDDHINFSFLWLRDDYLELMQRVTEFIYTKEKGQYSFMFSYFYMFFLLEDGTAVKNVVREKQNYFLLGLIESHFEDEDFMDLVFGVVCQFAPERRLQFIETFIKFSTKFESFKRLSIEPNQWSMVGSWVPVLQGHIDYLVSLLPLFNTVIFLDHRQYLEQKIRYLRNDMEREKKKDFSGDEIW